MDQDTERLTAEEQRDLFECALDTAQDELASLIKAMRRNRHG